MIAQQTLVAQWDHKVGSGQSLWTDGWDGYPVSRKKLLNFLAERKISNPVFIGGDVHANHVGHVKADFDNPNSAVVASEFVGTSISSEAGPQDRLDAQKKENPHMLLADGSKRGYIVMEIDAKKLKADLRLIDSEKTRDSTLSTQASFVVEAGSANIRKA